jgi:hypothetical protein
MMDDIGPFENGTSVARRNASVILKDTDRPIRAIVEFRDEAEILVTPRDVPKWTEDSNGRVISLDVASDGLSAIVVPHGVGETNLTVTTLDDHGTSVQLKDVVKIVAGEPTHGIIHWTLGGLQEGHSDSEPLRSSDLWVLPQPDPSQDELATGVQLPAGEPSSSESSLLSRTTHKVALLRRRRHRHRLRVALIVVLLLIVSGVGYVSVSYVFRSHPGAKSLNSALSAYRGGKDTARSNFRYEPPAQGVYALKGQGSERISFPPNSQSDGAVMPASVTYIAHGCWRWHLDYNTAHWEEYDFCPSDNQLVQTGYRNFQSWDFGTLTIKNLASFTCPSDTVVMAENPLAGQMLRWTCSGTNTSVSGKTTETVATPVVGTVALLIGKTTVKAVHEVQKLTLNGVQKGTAVENWWFSAATGLPLRVERHITILTASPLGTITYNEDGSWQMASVTPRT